MWKIRSLSSFQFLPLRAEIDTPVFTSGKCIIPATVDVVIRNIRLVLPPGGIGVGIDTADRLGIFLPHAVHPLTPVPVRLIDDVRCFGEGAGNLLRGADRILLPLHRTVDLNLLGSSKFRLLHGIVIRAVGNRPQKFIKNHLIFRQVSFRSKEQNVERFAPVVGCHSADAVHST